VAIKVLHTQYAEDPELRRRFMREGYVANKIDHPGAVAILDDDVAEDGALYLVMELLDGEPLSARLARADGGIPVGEVLAVAGQVLEVLAVAHDNAVVHRDIKPGNVFVTRGGYAKLLDFGLARLHDSSVSLVLTGQGTVMGTAGYMAPEQARGSVDEIDARTDLFSLGAVMFKALTGRRIHEHADPFDATLASMRNAAPPLASVLRGAAPLLCAAVDRALAFDKAARWGTARDMLGALRLAYDETSARPQPASPSPLPTPSGMTLEIPILVEEPSLVIDVTFGSFHDEAFARERARTREVVQELSGLSVAVDTERDPILRGRGEDPYPG